jgi:hypothetical protein
MSIKRCWCFIVVVVCLFRNEAAAMPSCDVLVVGGGAAGIAAALQSGRAGASTVLVERGSQVGGNMTSGGVNFPGLFHANGRQIIDGCAYEILTNAAALSGTTLPDFKVRTSQHWKHQIHVNIPDADASTAEKRAATNMRGRASMLRLFRFLRRQAGFETLRIGSVSAEVGVRETWRVEGDCVISCEDYVSGRVFEDAVCFAYYPVDLHSVSDGVTPRQLPEGVIPTVPFRALCVKGVPNMLVAGRCISADRLAASGLRVQGACMAMGQVAGQAAAMASVDGCDVRKLSLQMLRRSLKDSGAIIP